MVETSDEDSEDQRETNTIGTNQTTILEKTLINMISQ